MADTHIASQQSHDQNDRRDNLNEASMADATGVGNQEESLASGKKPAKRRKVNHACIYCRRSHMTCDLQRPCARCVKRDIGHLCHDEPREPGKKQKSDLEQMEEKEDDIAKDDFLPGFDRWDTGLVNNPFADMHHLHPYNSFVNTEVTNEFNLISDFLNSSMFDDPALFSNGNGQGVIDDPSFLATVGITSNMETPQAHQPSTQHLLPQIAKEIERPSSTAPLDNKAREKFFLTAADPAGNDSPEERMNRLLKAKYDAGMLRPFNYVNGYTRLNTYMEKNMRPQSRQKISRQLNQFRPKFREAMHNLTDIQLVKVEMWFERCLMEYDRVFASMAIPACCWRRTGEIYRGNKEMAELIHAPVESLRDGKIALHDIMVEDSLVSYWEKFGAIAFDQSQKAILTSCSLKNPDPSSKDPFLRCCFSFTIRRDTHNIPAMIVGNFLPIQPA